uniref:Apple domain-containing protein n=1 Tax=Dunaliella tertiolecta TaxID=3047 RepID=A0A7S3VSA0_DUNTE|mmetsp:Transcript_21545/g.59710  ORF Transcript_21545/g.59710 Transcript_21545/m.59710 type:complete len:239 (+) Transcript_21545:463-1179(+)
MQRKPVTDKERREGVGYAHGDTLYVVEQAPVSFIPFVLVVMAVVLGAVWCGRGEVWNAYVGAKAYVSQSIVGRASTALRLQGPLAVTAAAPAHVPTITKRKITLPDSKVFEIWDEPIPASCNAEQHTDYDGYAVQWGLGHFARSAAECCKLCQEFKPKPGVPHTCNTWVWCGDPSGTCWTPDIHTHHTGSCWLKYRETPKVNSKGDFPPEFRAEHKTAPLKVPQTSGVLKKPASPAAR